MINAGAYSTFHQQKMLFFCPLCGNLLGVERPGDKDSKLPHRFACTTCPYVHKLKGARMTSQKTYPKLKELDDVMGGKAAWDGADSTDITCTKCEHTRAYFHQMQTRSADEPMTIFYRCCNMQCNNQWRD